MIIAKSFINIPRIKPTSVIEMYDLRFIFELLYNGYCPSNDEIKRLNIHFYIHFYSKLKNCIILNDRELTIKNIEKDSYLFSLKQKPRLKEEIKKKNKLGFYSHRVINPLIKLIININCSILAIILTGIVKGVISP